jgi:DNA-binding response OmpR family regulator
VRKHILIIEDDEDIRNIAGFILESEGYRVSGCSCQLEGLDTFKPDLILLDEWVNLKEGHMICKEIKTIQHLMHVPVIIFSTATDIAGIAANCKADGFVPKPFDLDMLLDEVRRCLPLSAHA